MTHGQIHRRAAKTQKRRETWVIALQRDMTHGQIHRRAAKTRERRETWVIAL